MLREVHAVERRRPAAQLAGDGGQRVEVVDKPDAWLVDGPIESVPDGASITNHVRGCRKPVHHALRLVHEVRAPCENRGK